MTKMLIVTLSFLALSSNAYAGNAESLITGVGTGLTVGAATRSPIAGVGTGLIAAVAASRSGCSTADVEDNVLRAEGALIALATSTEFNNAQMFQAHVAELSGLPTEEKLATALHSVGVDLASEADIDAFMTASMTGFEKSKFAKAARKNLDLNNKQAARVLETLETAVFGGLK